MLDDGIEQRNEVFPLAGLGQIGHRNALARVGVHDRKINLVIGGFEIKEQLINFFQHFGHAGIGTIDLVDDHDDLHVAL